MTLWSLLAKILAAIFGKMLEALRIKRQDEDRIETHERAATAEAEVETEDVISEIADNRGKLVTGGDARAIADRLRKRRSFGNPGSGEKDAGA